MPSSQQFILGDQPADAKEISWQGYFHNTDPTVLPTNCLTFPSQNCFIPNKDKIVPRLGKTLLGAERTADKNWPIIGHKKRFATMGGDVIEVRVTKTDDENIKDLIEVLYDNPLTGEPTWYPITIGLHSPNINPITQGLHRYYMDDWFDTNLNPSLSLNVPRLIWVNGNKQVYSWIGAIAPIVNVNNNYLSVSFGTIDYSGLVGTFHSPTELITGGTSGATAWIGTNAAGVLEIVRISGTFQVGETITGTTSAAHAVVVSYTPPPTTWASLGFIDPSISGETGDIIINGLEYSSVSGWDSASLQFAPTTPTVVVGDVAFSEIRVDDVDVAFDICRNNKNYMFYGNWRSRRLYMSNNFGHDASQDITSVQANQNDLIVSGSYTGAGSHTLRYQIDSVVDDPVEYFYDPDTAGGDTVDNAFFSGSHIGVNRDVYRVVITNATVGTERFQVFKNNISVSINNAITYDTPTLLPGATSDGISITFVKIDDTVTPYKVNQSWTYIIGGQDTYSIYLDGVVVVSGQPASTPYTTQGVTLKVNSSSGHSLGDYWEVTLSQLVDEAWKNFYYTIPVRKPGEGYIYQLSSNFWTMEPQEEEMYVNTQYGYWDYVSTVLSADLQSETVSLTPLKHASASKVIFPYMITHLDNDLIFVTENKTLDMIGRREFLELPQIGYLSQPVDLDFQVASFEDGSMEYLNKQLFITSPKESIMLCYDNQDGNKYWQPPQVISENGILSIVGNTLISHSNLRNQTFQLFTGQSDNGAAYTVRARTPYNSYGNRWGLKNSNKSFLEGYLKGKPPMIFTVYLGVHGCGGILSHPVEPIVCLLPTKAPFGEGSNGSHPFGSDIFDGDLSHFNEICPKFNPILQFYFAALELECTTKNHTYSWLTIALNAAISSTGNTALIPEQVISKT